ncbi:hypothetical protein NDU88_005270 [Pleurodeles waltl]|uniref:Uncharacterized protein n=1 Tax=Pleurodeles waltl TaxID=8319 RepID=A0AAV7MGD7_PLEWA|nr:hypothetical protein NDU88_005270 [Pleurodeles waltl]
MPTFPPSFRVPPLPNGGLLARGRPPAAPAGSPREAGHHSLSFSWGELGYTTQSNPPTLGPRSHPLYLHSRRQLPDPWTQSSITAVLLSSGSGNADNGPLWCTSWVASPTPLLRWALDRGPLCPLRLLFPSGPFRPQHTLQPWPPAATVPAGPIISGSDGAPRPLFRQLGAAAPSLCHYYRDGRSSLFVRPCTGLHLGP